MNIKNTVEKILTKKYLLYILLLGILIMVIPGFSGGNENEKHSRGFAEKIDENRLERMLEKIDGIKSAEVFITYRDSGTVSYAYDIKSSDNQQDLEIKMSDKKPVVSKTINPRIDGILVVIEGENLSQSNLCNLVKASTGVPLHRICVVFSKGD